MRARLASAYVRAGGDDEKAARIFGVTIGSARLAKRRHLDAPKIDHRRRAS
jgi:transposase